MIKDLTPVSRFLEEYAVLPQRLDVMKIKTVDAAGYYLAEDVYVPSDLPGFFKSRVDGYAVNSRDIENASRSNPVELELVGEVRMGEVVTEVMKPGQCVYVPTGGMMPPGSDAAVKIEDTEKTTRGTIRFFESIKRFENTVRKDEDYRAGDLLLKAGTLLSSHKIMGLFYAGIEEVTVYRKARVAVMSTGDEIIEPFQKPGPAQARDSSSYSIVLMLREKGFNAERLGIVKDDPETFKKTILDAWEKFDVLLVCGGSSAGKKDFTKGVFEELGKPGVLVHGVRMKPGKPLIFAMANGKVLIGLPGHPVSSYVTARILALPVLVHISGGVYRHNPDAKVIAAEDIPSEKEREEYVRVRLIRKNDRIFAQPILGTSSIISTVVNSHGLVRVPAGVDRIPEGSELDFFRW